MPIRMVRSPFTDRGGGHSGPGWAPRVFCDACGEIIDDAQDANVVWPSPVALEELRAAAPVDVCFVHKGACDQVVQERLRAGGVVILWTDLIDFPIELANHTTPTGRHPEFGPLVVRAPAPPRYTPPPDSPERAGRA